MKKLLPALLALLLLLTACGGSSKSDSAASWDRPAEDKADFNYGGGWATDDAAPMTPEAAPAPEVSGGEAPSPDLNAKMIYTADLSLQTKEFDAAAEALDQIVEDLGGYYERHSLDQGGSYRSLTCTIRVPAEHFEDLLEQAGRAAHATSCQRYSENVSEAYYDTEARLKTQQTKLDRLHALLEEAATMEDIISLENALSDTELQIEYLTGSLRHYDSLIGYSTVRVDLQEVYKLSTDEAEPPATFGERISAAFAHGLRRGVDNMEDFIVSLARNWMGVTALVVLAVVAVLVLRRRRNKKLTARSAAAPAPGGDEAPKS